MAYWFISDTHFGHTNIITYCQRPFKSVEQMNEVMIKKWNEKVKPTDTVFHLGDFSFRGGFHQYKQRLNGTIILLAGNHDETAFSVIRDMTIKHGGKEFYLTHIPPENQVKDICLCGHVHNKWKSKKNGNKIMINMSVDVWNFYPVSINEILAEIEKVKRS